MQLTPVQPTTVPPTTVQPTTVQHDKRRDTRQISMRGAIVSSLALVVLVLALGATLSIAALMRADTMVANLMGQHARQSQLATKRLIWQINSGGRT